MDVRSPPAVGMRARDEMPWDRSVGRTFRRKVSDAEMVACAGAGRIGASARENGKSDLMGDRCIPSVDEIQSH